MPMLEEEAKKRQIRKPSSVVTKVSPQKSREQASKIFNVNDYLPE